MKKFPSIGQMKDVIRTVRERHDYQGRDENDAPIYRHVSNYPTIKFKGTVKLHGTNAAIVKYANGDMNFQSRERILTMNEDNANFMSTMSSKELNFLFDGFVYNDYVAIYGEWCGGNIQKNVALNALEKMFVIFDAFLNNDKKTKNFLKVLTTFPIDCFKILFP
jgi:hypothetical protein